MELNLLDDDVQDAILKIDGYIDGDPSKPIQIKHRKIEVKDRNDLAYEVCRNFKSNKELETQLKNTHQQGRDYKGNGIKYYFLLNNSETIIYQLCGDLIKNYICSPFPEDFKNDTRENLLRKS